MKYLSLLLTVVLLGLLGCSDANLVGTELEARQASDAVSMAKNTVKYVPFTARFPDGGTNLFQEPRDDILI